MLYCASSDCPLSGNGITFKPGIWIQALSFYANTFSKFLDFMMLPYPPAHKVKFLKNSALNKSILLDCYYKNSICFHYTFPGMVGLGNNSLVSQLLFQSENDSSFKT